MRKAVNDKVMENGLGNGKEEVFARLQEKDAHLADFLRKIIMIYRVEMCNKGEKIEGIPKKYTSWVLGLDRKTSWYIMREEGR